MNKNNIISQIKALFTQEAEQEVNNFLDVKTADSRILRVSDLAVGATVMEITEEGEVAVEDGEYTLEDGITLVVVEGLISEIKEVEEETEEGTEVTVEVTDEQMESEEDSSVTEQSFMDIMLKDGQPAQIIAQMEGTITIGDKLVIAGFEAGPGEYPTNDGKVLVVGANMGIIEDIREEVAEEVPAEAEMEEEKEITGVVNNLKELISQVKELKSQFEAIKAENEELKTTISKFAAAPSATPTKTKVDFNKANKEERLRFFSEK